MQMLYLAASFKRYEGYSLTDFWNMYPFELDAFLLILEDLRKKDAKNQQ